MGNLHEVTCCRFACNLLDRINRNSIGMDEYFDRLFDLHETTMQRILHTTLVTVSKCRV